MLRWNRDSISKGFRDIGGPKHIIYEVKYRDRIRIRPLVRKSPEISQNCSIDEVAGNRQTWAMWRSYIIQHFFHYALTYLKSQTETQWEIAHFLNCDTEQSTFGVGATVATSGAKSTADFYVCAANYCRSFQLRDATNHPTFQHMGPTSIHSSHPD